MVSDYKDVVDSVAINERTTKTLATKTPTTVRVAEEQQKTGLTTHELIVVSHMSGTYTSDL